MPCKSRVDLKQIADAVYDEYGDDIVTRVKADINSTSGNTAPAAAPTVVAPAPNVTVNCECGGGQAAPATVVGGKDYALDKLDFPDDGFVQTGERNLFFNFHPNGHTYLEARELRNDHREIRLFDLTPLRVACGYCGDYETQSGLIVTNDTSGGNGGASGGNGNTGGNGGASGVNVDQYGKPMPNNATSVYTDPHTMDKFYVYDGAVLKTANQFVKNMLPLTDGTTYSLTIYDADGKQRVYPISGVSSNTDGTVSIILEGDVMTSYGEVQSGIEVNVTKTTDGSAQTSLSFLVDFTA